MSRILLLAITLFLFMFTASGRLLVFDIKAREKTPEVNPRDIKRPNLSRPERSSPRPKFIGEFKETDFPLTAKNILVSDAFTGESLYTRDAHEIAPIASLTKLMTALVMLDNNINFDDEIEIISSDLRGGMPEALLPGEKVKVKDLWNLMLSASSNSAAFALVRALGISQDNFVNLMNEKASHSFLFELSFADLSGLNPANKGSARNLARLAKIAFSQSQIAQALRQAAYEFTTLNSGRVVRVDSTNWLLASGLNQPPYQIVGGKTGYLDEIKYNLVTQVKKGDNSIIVVVLGSETKESRFEEAENLARWVFGHYEWPHQ